MSDTAPPDSARFDSPAATPPVAPSGAPAFPRELEDDFVPVALLGGGRAGVVWQVRERNGRRQVALKVAQRDADSADIEWRRCQREARMARRLKHRHVAAVVDAGVRGDLAYTAWRFCADGTLAGRQDAREEFPVERVLALVGEIASALEHAQERGVWHGALSPHAVLLDSAGHAQVADFRIVQDDDHPEDELPLAARVPTYHAPEQRRARDGQLVGPQVDQYALGLIAYELLSGDRREARLGARSMYALDLLEVPEGRELRPGLPLAANLVLRRATAHDPEERFETVRAFADALAEACAPPPPPEPEPEPVADRAPTSPTPLWHWQALRKRELPPMARLLLVLVGAVVVLSLTVVWIVTRAAAGPAPTLATERRSAVRSPRRAAAAAPAFGVPSGEVSPLGLAQMEARRRLGEILVVPLGASAGAVAVVDDVVRGAVPRVVRLRAGEHRVSLRDPRRVYAPAETTVTVTPGARITINFR